MRDVPEADTDRITIVYDGDCPFCAAYVRMTRLRQAVGNVEMVNARDTHPILDEITAAGLDLDNGMVVKYNGALHHGDAAMTMLALQTTPSGVFNRMMRVMFSSPRAAKVLYPPLVAGRNLVLRILGRSKINQA